MNSDYETFPDDLRLRYHFCRRFHHIATTFPPLFAYPYTVIAGLMNGKVEIGFADRGKPPLLLRAGEVCILPANCRRHTKSLSPGGADFIAAGFLFEVKGGMDFLSFYDLALRLGKLTERILHKLLQELLGLEIDSPGRTDLQRNRTHPASSGSVARLPRRSRRRQGAGRPGPLRQRPTCRNRHRAGA